MYHSHRYCETMARFFAMMCQLGSFLTEENGTLSCSLPIHRMRINPSTCAATGSVQRKRVPLLSSCATCCFAEPSDPVLHHGVHLCSSSPSRMVAGVFAATTASSTASSCTSPTAFPASDQLFDLFKNAKYFSTHDCTWGYHQLRWGPSSVPYTAIKTHLGTFEFLVMNFGPTSSPAQWQRLMETILRGVLGECCVIFLDDLCVYSNTAEEHMQHLNKVYRLLAKNSIYLRFAKCFFFNTQFKFLGWIIKEGTMAADPDKVSTLTTWPHPVNKREVRSFTGFTNFYRRLIPKYTEMM